MCLSRKSPSIESLSSAQFFLVGGQLGCQVLHSRLSTALVVGTGNSMPQRDMEIAVAVGHFLVSYQQDLLTMRLGQAGFIPSGVVSVFNLLLQTPLPNSSQKSQKIMAGEESG